MAHVDKEIINIINIFRDKELKKAVGDGDEIVVDKIGCRFNLSYESMLSTMIEVDYRKCIDLVLKSASKIDDMEEPDLLYHIIEGGDGDKGMYVGISSDKNQDIITFILKQINIYNIANWLFMCSVVGNIVAARYMKPFLADVVLLEAGGKIVDLKKMYEYKIKQTEIPQLTMSDTCAYKKATEIVVDDFEIWNYYYDQPIYL